jgi:hypothetical protein
MEDEVFLYKGFKIRKKSETRWIITLHNKHSGRRYSKDHISLEEAHRGCDRAIRDMLGGVFIALERHFQEKKLQCQASDEDVRNAIWWIKKLQTERADRFPALSELVKIVKQ